MSGKRKVKLPGRYLGEGIMWYVVQFAMDNIFSDPVSAEDIEDSEGKTGSEKNFAVGDMCSAVWRDTLSYEGKVVFAADDKEKCAKFINENKKRKNVKRKSNDDNLAKKKREAAEKKRREKNKSQKRPSEMLKIYLEHLCQPTPITLCLQTRLPPQLHLPSLLTMSLFPTINLLKVCLQTWLPSSQLHLPSLVTMYQFPPINLLKVCLQSWLPPQLHLP